MEFSGSQPIYLQIAEIICGKILSNEWKAGDRIPSVRELAVTVEVNPNTIMRTFSFLQEREIISNQRGIGFFVTDEGRANAKKYLSENFINNELKNIFKTMDLLSMNLSDIKALYNGYKNSGGKNENEINK
jgi:GntR family transcriptional regulator